MQSKYIFKTCSSLDSFLDIRTINLYNIMLWMTGKYLVYRALVKTKTGVCTYIHLNVDLIQRCAPTIRQ